MRDEGTLSGMQYGDHQFLLGCGWATAEPDDSVGCLLDLTAAQPNVNVVAVNSVLQELSARCYPVLAGTETRDDLVDTHRVDTALSIVCCEPR